MGGKDESKIDIRPSSIAGRWYDDNPHRLGLEIDGYISNATIPELKGDVIAVISPHAGYQYSGRTAGHAFRSVQGSARERVAVVSPLHAYHSAGLLTSGHQAYTTPFGKVEIDQEMLQTFEKLLFSQGLTITRITRDGEHSLEIELPFLQRTLKGDFKLLPLMARDHDPHTCQIVGKALAEILRPYSSLMVASTDLSHFYPQNIAHTFDEEMLRQISAFSPEGVLEAERSGRGYACGAAAVAVVLNAARELGANTVELLHYSNSGDETGDYSQVVGYGAAAILKRT